MTSVAALLMLALTSAHPALPIPDGWVAPTERYTSQTWRSSSVSRYMSVSGDFNGDGLTDHAKILLSRDGKHYGIFAFMGDAGGKFTVRPIVVPEEIEYLPEMGIEKVAPGIEIYKCSDGSWECDDGEFVKFVLKHDAINYFMNESANSYFIWNKETDGFDRVWISD